MKPGQFLTIIGASGTPSLLTIIGAGKTTLLNYLANRDPSKNITKTGEVLINGAERSKVDFEKYIGYVQQDDVLYQTLTVYECLLFAAKMRLPSSVDHNGRVRQILESLKLEKAADTKIGGPLVKGVSGGERKRASIAVELITDPTLIFLDEPTTGLDSYTATSVIEALVEMAASGRTVIATIHQPNSEMYAAFDQLMLMSQGKVIYMNKASNAINYFSKIGYSWPEHSNPADYFMNIMSVENEEIDDEDMDKVIKRKSEMEVKFGKKIDKLAEFYENSEFRWDTDFQFPHLVDLRTKSFPIFNANIFLQIYLLSQRAYRNSIRIKLTSNVRLISTVIISIIAVLVFGRLGNDSSSIQNRNGLIFFLCMQYIFNVIQSGINVFPDETPVFYREYSNRMYSSLIYFICRSLGDLPGIILSNTIMWVIVYFSNGLNTTDASHFFIFYFYSLLLSWAALGLGFIPGAIFKSKEAGFTMIPLFLIPTLMVSGFYVKQSNFISKLNQNYFLSKLSFLLCYYVHKNIVKLKFINALI